MPSDLPIACTLTPGELPGRLAEMRAIGEASLLEVERGAARVRLRFAGAGPARERLDAVVDAERRCCAFLDLELRDEGGARVLTVTAPPGGEAMAHELADAFAGGRA